MIPNNLPKNNHPKLKWWQKGALWGFGFGFLAVIWWDLSASLATAPHFGFFIPLVPVFPIFWLLFYVIHLDYLPAIFISWIIGGIFYARILRWLTQE